MQAAPTAAYQTKGATIHAAIYTLEWYVQLAISTINQNGGKKATTPINRNTMSFGSTAVVHGNSHAVVSYQVCDSI